MLRNKVKYFLACFLSSIFWGATKASENHALLNNFQMRLQQEAIATDVPRRLYHTHLQSANLYGNSTDLQYFYVDVFVGS